MARLGFGFGLGLGAWRRPGTMIDFIGPALPPGARLSRASRGYWSDPGGVLRSAAIDAARFDHSVSGAARGLLIERAALNILPSGGDAGVWRVATSSAPVVLLAAGGQAPDGSASAARIDYPPSSGSGFAFAYDVSVSPPAGNYTQSIWLRGEVGGERLWLTLTNDARWLSQPVVLTTEWQRFSHLVALDQGVWFFTLGVDLRDPGQSPQGAQRCYAWGPQLETGVATSTTPPGAARAADQLSIDAAALGLGDGPARLRLILDDGSAVLRDVVASGGQIAIAPDLPRPWLRRIERV